MTDPKGTWSDGGKVWNGEPMQGAEILADDMENAVSVGLVMYDPLRNERSNRYLSDGEIALIVTLLRAKAEDSSALMPPRTET